MHVIVTGAAGFIGSHLCERLVRDDDEVAVVLLALAVLLIATGMLFLGGSS